MDKEKELINRIARVLRVSDISIKEVEINGSVINVLYWNGSGELARKTLYRKVKYK